MSQHRTSQHRTPPGGADRVRASGASGGADRPPALAELPHYAERVLDVAELIPPGRVMTYGDVAEWLGDGGPRQVGRAMALYGSAVPWWRVVRSDGKLLPGHEQRALGHYREEGTPLREAPAAADGHLPRLDMRRARWDGRDGTRPGDGGGSGGAGPGGSEEPHI
ncbi:MGMT family protein [uncultured Streptomyces sp.]|uniref:MGMT family protein n=1 Tax=uncultured Streptomyces sp. TaxID=174707 RepID=UPI00261B6D11|nr:MGMT family protein [uncultured Streptomyces sp.]